MKQIQLTNGQFAMVDDIDYVYLCHWKWWAQQSGNNTYAVSDLHFAKDRISMHQLVAERLGFKHLADHINLNGLDNRRLNLRPATHKQNLENTRLHRHNTSGFKGVSWVNKSSKWQATIKHNGKHIYLGVFDKIEDAVTARKAAEDKYFTHHRSD